MKSVIQLTIMLISISVFSHTSYYHTQELKKVKKTNEKLNYIPLSVGLLPGISMNSMSNIKTLNNLSYGLIIDDGYATRGISFSSLATVKTGWLEGIQIGGLFNILGGDLLGVQIAGVFNLSSGNINGVQVAGIFNMGKNLTGVQIGGLANLAKNTQGIQLGGIINISEDITGVQVAGVVNKANDVKGVQIGGILNMAKKVKGIQIGLVNIADDSTFSLGLVNIIKNGRFHVSTIMDDQKTGSIEIKNGGSHWHMIYSLSSEFENKDEFTLGVGLGFHIPVNDKFFTDIDIMTFNDIDLAKNFTNNDWKSTQSALRIQFGFKLTDKLALTAGAKLNIVVQKGNKERPNGIDGWLLKDGKNDKNTNEVYMWPGLVVGLQFF